MTEIKVLYAEDEPFLAQIVSEGLSSSGYEVLHSTDGQLALQLFKQNRPDICILDIMMPMKDGYTLASEIRKMSPDTPIIFLSAKTLTADVIKGFNSGGHDYLKKPFSIDELMVRMDSLLRRFLPNKQTMEEKKTTFYQFGNCSLDTVHQLLCTSTAEHTISYKETALLELMLLHANKVLERQTALLQIWGDDSYYNTRSMDVFLTHLRKLLKDEKEVQIMNIRGVGYKLIHKTGEGAL